ncbi:MAG: hypothetical protein ACI8Z9_002322, partial [Paraglaciecola sp.]
MKSVNWVKGLLSALAILVSPAGLAAWENVQSDVDITQSRAAMDRVNRVYFSVVSIENAGNSNLVGPFRVLIEQATLQVVNNDGETAEGVPYFEFVAGSLAPGEKMSARVDFTLQRSRLSFSSRLQRDTPWDLVWNDEFDGTSIDSSKWTHEVNCDGGGNQEQQCYTQSVENAFVEDGKLKIVAKAESGEALPYSSARLVSKDKGDWTYGRF